VGWETEVFVLNDQRVALGLGLQSSSSSTGVTADSQNLHSSWCRRGGNCHLVIGFSPSDTRVMDYNHVASPHWPRGPLSLLGFILRLKLTTGSEMVRAQIGNLSRS